jgi:hypothetical protein
MTKTQVLRQVGVSGFDDTKGRSNELSRVLLLRSNANRASRQPVALYLVWVLREACSEVASVSESSAELS